MIVKIAGKVDKVESGKVIINTISGLSYEIFITKNDEMFLLKNSDVVLHTFLEIKENEHILYGFIEEAEKDFFKKLITINGIGCKTVINILSKTNPIEFIHNVETENVKEISNLPKIGLKTAEKIIVECKSKMKDFHNILHNLNVINMNVINESIDTLKSIGFNPKIEDIKEIYKKGDLTEDIVKQYISIKNKKAS